MACQHNHNDPNDHPSNRHVARCYRAWEEFFDRDGRMTEAEFEATSIEEKIGVLETCTGGPLPDDILEQQYDE